VDALRPFTNSLNPKKTAVTYFYFDYNDQETQNAEYVVSCLLKQLLYQVNSFPSKIVAHYEQCAKRGNEKPDLDTLTDLFQECTKQFSTVFVLFDAFDEFLDGKNHQMALLDSLCKFSASGLKIFMTSRPHLRLLEDVKKSLKTAESDVIRLKADRQDIQLYLLENLKEKAKDIDQDLQKEIVDVIASGVDGRYSSCRKTLT
jgi:hypothetical protein